MDYSLDHIEANLKKRWEHPYVWNKKQDNAWDNATKCIYKTPIWEEVVGQIKQCAAANHFDEVTFFNYAINRWYNFWSAQAVEQIFTALPGFAVNPKPLENHYDFKWLGETIDHKTSVFPRGFGEDYAFAKAHKTQLLNWFYKYQSTGQRFHLNNRLFIVVHDNNGEHWKLKAEIELLRAAIEPYDRQNTPAVLEVLNLQDGKETMADIMWVER